MLCRRITYLKGHILLNKIRQRLSIGDLKVYGYPVVGFHNDFTQQLIKMKEKVDQFHMYFYSKKPYFLKNDKSTKKETVKIKFNRRNSVVPGSFDYKLLSLVGTQSLPNHSSPNKIKGRNISADLDSKLKDKLHLRIKNESKKRIDEISDNSLSDSNNLCSDINNSRDSQKDIKSGSRNGYLNKPSSKCIESMMQERRLSSRKMDRLIEQAKIKPVLHRNSNQSLPELEVPTNKQNSKNFKTDDLSSPRCQAESTFDNRATNETNDMKFDSELQDIFKYSTFIKEDSKLSKTQSHQTFNNYLKDHLKYKNTAEFYLSNMQDRINVLETTKKFKRNKSKKLLRKIHKKAIKISASRLKVKNLMIERSFSPSKRSKCLNYQKANPNKFQKKPKTHRVIRRNEVINSVHNIRMRKQELAPLKRSIAKISIPRNSKKNLVKKDASMLKSLDAFAASTIDARSRGAYTRFKKVRSRKSKSKITKEANTDRNTRLGTSKECELL
ncbi:unnamed protein product [Moneuplotes crassus]|uniref:Uncharacterized protein n=1 Tax=Euplotes crassus TaxID=5936 RepID=A0AAD1U249_EUPCR|nr:unnamed protein product [Moneuplotes crassus]